MYKRCGKFGICRDNDDEQMCQCPHGYEAASLEEWNSGIFSGGCERVSKCSQNQTFTNILLKNVVGQVSEYQAMEEEECKAECLNRCSCVAYSFNSVTVTGPRKSYPNCSTWTSDLVFQSDGNEGALILSLRVSPSPSGPGNFMEILHIIQL